MAEIKTFIVSDVFHCNVCGTEICVNRALIGIKEGVQIINFKCPICGQLISKEKPAGS